MDNTAIRGCNKKCACRLWVNCHYYIDKKRQEERLKNKEYDFWEWYDTYYRSLPTLQDIAANG